MRLREHFQISRRALTHCFYLSKRYTLSLMISAFLASILPYIPVYFSAKVIDALYEKAAVGTILMYVALTVGLVFLLNLLKTYVASMKDTYNAEIYRQEDWQYSEKAMELAYESIESADIKRLRYRVRRESQTGYNRWYLHVCIERITADLTKIGASLALTISFFGIGLIPVYVKLALVGGLILTLCVTMFSTLNVEKMNREFMEASVELNIFSEQYLAYIEDYSAGKDIRLYGMRDHLADSYLKMAADYYNAAVKNSYRMAAWQIPGAVLEKVFQFALYAVLIYAALQGGASVGSIAKYVACLLLLINSVGDLVTALQRSFENHHYLKRYFSYFDIPNNMYKGSLTVEKRDDNEYDVEFRDVSFRYPGADSYALRHVNLKFKVGEKLALVGENGSGKTTLIKLLCRLYDPTEGEILLNGVNIQKYNYDEYMSIFSVVFQDFQLFAFKLGEVVASGKQFDAKKVRTCLEKAGFGERLADLPEGADTYLYKGYEKSGIEISGGEAQKIALARALYKDAPFILLDEPTAALDPISEYEVYMNFNAISGDKTTIYISHRLASCRFCDKIAVFEKGQIVQTGNHETLVVDESGKYHELWNAQAQYYLN